MTTTTRATTALLALLLAPLGCGGGDDPSASDTPISCDDVGASVPGGRGELQGAWDAARQRMVVFGGNQAVPINCSPGATDFVGQTWAWSEACGGFTQIDTADAPHARGRFAGALDADGKRLIVHGGRFRNGDSGDYTLYDDTWAFDFATDSWSKIAGGAGAPEARFDHGGAVVGGKLWVFGGNTSASGATITPNADTWTLDLATGKWSEVSTTNDPPARVYHAVATDGKKLYAYGGGDENALFGGGFLGDLWALDLDSGKWTELAPFDLSTGPDSRIWMHLAYDAGGNRLILFGGHNNGVLGNDSELWQFNLGNNSWKRLNKGDVYNAPSNDVCDFPADFTKIDENGPERRSGGAWAVTDDGRMLIFGGKTDCGNINDVWALDLATDAWQLKSKANEGEVCLRFSNDCSTMCF